jgi:hypothetical protein
MKKDKAFSTNSALAASIQAFRVNGRVYRDVVKINDVDYLPNRLIITNALNGDTVAQQDLDEAEEIKTYLRQTHMMQTLTKGNADSFLDNIVEILNQESVTAREFGLLAWAPKLSSDLQLKDEAREKSSHYERQSSYLGRVGDKIQIEFTLIESRYVPSMDCYTVYGHSKEGNLVFYWAKGEKKIVKQGRIEGRVKKQEPDSYHGNARVTTLNYVKVL